MRSLWHQEAGTGSERMGGGWFRAAVTGGASPGREAAALVLGCWWAPSFCSCCPGSRLFLGSADRSCGPGGSGAQTLGRREPGRDRSPVDAHVLLPFDGLMTWGRERVQLTLPGGQSRSPQSRPVCVTREVPPSHPSRPGPPGSERGLAGLTALVSLYLGVACDQSRILG